MISLLSTIILVEEGSERDYASRTEGIGIGVPLDLANYSGECFAPRDEGEMSLLIGSIRLVSPPWIPFIEYTIDLIKSSHQTCDE